MASECKETVAWNTDFNYTVYELRFFNSCNSYYSLKISGVTLGKHLCLIFIKSLNRGGGGGRERWPLQRRILGGAKPVKIGAKRMNVDNLI